MRQTVWGACLSVTKRLDRPAGLEDVNRIKESSLKCTSNWTPALPVAVVVDLPVPLVPTGVTGGLDFFGNQVGVCKAARARLFSERRVSTPPRDGG